MVQHLRTYFILHAITMKWTMCVQEKIEHSSMPHRPRLSSTIFRRYLLSYKDLATTNKSQKNSRVAKCWRPSAQGWCLPPHASPCHPMHPMPPIGYGPGTPSKTSISQIFPLKGFKHELRMLSKWLTNLMDIDLASSCGMLQTN